MGARISCDVSFAIAKSASEAIRRNRHSAGFTLLLHQDQARHRQLVQATFLGRRVCRGYQFSPHSALLSLLRHSFISIVVFGCCRQLSAWAIFSRVSCQASLVIANNFLAVSLVSRSKLGRPFTAVEHRVGAEKLKVHFTWFEFLIAGCFANRSGPESQGPIATLPLTFASFIQ